MSTRRESEDLPRFEETAGEVCLTSKYGKQRNCSELKKKYFIYIVLYIILYVQIVLRRLSKSPESTPKAP